MVQLSYKQPARMRKQFFVNGFFVLSGQSRSARGECRRKEPKAITDREIGRSRAGPIPELTRFETFQWLLSPKTRRTGVSMVEHV